VSAHLSPARQITSRLIDHSRALGASGLYFAHPPAAALDRLYLDLARWVGFDGCHALFTRGLAEARTKHPILDTIELHPRSNPYLEGVAKTVEQHGARETDHALEAMLLIVVEVLGRLIGDEMATILIERGLPKSGDDGADRESGKKEA
jgi:hypothetical protein